MVSGAGGILVAWKLDEGLTVAEIRRRGGARLGFVGYGGCGTGWWAQRFCGGQLKAGRDLGVRAVGHAGENLAGKLGSVSSLGKEGKGGEGADTRARASREGGAA